MLTQFSLLERLHSLPYQFSAFGVAVILRLTRTAETAGFRVGSCFPIASRDSPL